MSSIHRPSPLAAVSSIIIAMGLMAVNSGILFAYVPIKLAAGGFAPWVAGSMITAMALGGIVGCLGTGWVVHRVGHARTFSFMAALIIISVLLVAIELNPITWIVARAIYGVAGTGLFIVSQSWLNDAVENQWRGKVIALFYMTFILSLGFGSYLISFLDLDTAEAPMVGIFFIALALLPMSLTRLPAPAPPESITIAVRAVWAISPVGLIGLLAVGGMTMLVQGFAPIYTASIGYMKNDIALMMFLMQFGMLAIQLPLGTLSDRTDRRYMLLLACLIIIASAFLASYLSEIPFLGLVMIFAIWAGATESIYAIANAHASDRADPQYYVSLTSTLLIAWSVSGFVIPLLATALTPIFGPKTFMYMAIVIAVAYALFVVVRLRMSVAVPRHETEPFVAISGQAPYTTELAFGDMDLPTQEHTNQV